MASIAATAATATTATSSSDNSNNHKITEAQLRWAQFHHKRKAVGVRESIQSLYSFPATRQEVPGALPDDDRSSIVSASFNRFSKPSISKGRRALLRVSQRAYEQRKEHIQEHGFTNEAMDSEDEELGGRRRPAAASDPDRWQRFQAAYNMMMEKSQQPVVTLPTSTRIWTRSGESAPPTWHAWANRLRPSASENVQWKPVLAPLDRGASWMTLLPKAVPVARPNPYQHLTLAQVANGELPPLVERIPSSGPMEISNPDHFQRLVAMVQQRLIQQSPSDRPNIPLHPNSQPPKERKVHYVPRMHLQDFDPNAKSPSPRAKTMEMVQSYQSSNSKKLRRASKTRQMAKSLEAESTRPRMKLRPSWEATEVIPRQELLETTELQQPRRYSLPNSGELYDMQQQQQQQQQENMGHPPGMSQMSTSRSKHVRVNSWGQGGPNGQRPGGQPRLPPSSSTPRSKHPLVDSWEQGQDVQRGNDQQALSPSASTPRSKHPMVQSWEQGMTPEQTAEQQSRQQEPRRQSSLAQEWEKGMVSQSSPSRNVSTSGMEPFRRQTHPLVQTWEQSVGASPDSRASPRRQTLQQQHQRGSYSSKDAPNIPTLPDQYPSNYNASKQPRTSTGTLISDKTQQRYSKGNGGGSQRVSDFFASIRQEANPPDPSGSNQAANETRTSLDPKERINNMPRTSTGTAIADPSRLLSGTVGNQRVSDFFASIRQSSSGKDEQPLEESDFFAQVREMMSTDDDDEATANQRVSDFFAQIREMSGQDDDGFQQFPPSSNMPPRNSNGSQFQGLNRKSTDSHDEDTKSEHSAISDLWNRGRSSWNAFATSLTAITEKNASGVSRKDQQQAGAAPTRDSAGSSIPGRVGNFLQMLDGKKKQSTSPIALPVEEPTETSGLPQKPREELEYDAENDMEAMAAYRRSQEHKRHSEIPDDASSNSSFRALPDGIRQVVKQRNSSPKRVSREFQNNNHYYDDQREIQIPTPSGPEIGFSFLKDTPKGNGGMPPRSTPASPSRTIGTGSSFDNMSPEKYKQAHGKLMQNSPLMGGSRQEVIDTDDTSSDASNPGMDPRMLANFLLSPDILQERLHQAIGAVEESRWDHVTYLLNANPWLAEMCEVTTNQYLLHKLAFFGTSSPPEIFEELVGMFPAAVYKFDQDGNVPLHLAAAAGHLQMIEMLGEKFKEGASIRNEDGMLPLHFTIASYGEYTGNYGDETQDLNEPNPIQVIKKVLSFFPQAVAIADNDGNLPIHVAAECLSGSLGVDAIYLLLDEAERQLADPYGVRFRSKVKVEEPLDDTISAASMPTARDSDMEEAEDIHCNMVKNDFGETPLLSAVRSRRGWDIIEALISGPGGLAAAISKNTDDNNALHLLVQDYQDPVAAMSILKYAPKTVTKRNRDGMLPIECACLQLMPEEVILAIALVDLPFDIDDKDGLKFRDGFGGSWWYLTCECDDHYVSLVQEIVVLCTFRQIRALCFMEGANGPSDTVLSRATPKCQQVLTQALRYLGRFEFVGDAPLEVDPLRGLKVFEALDYANEDTDSGGRPVVLKCFSELESFQQEIKTLEDFQLDPLFIEDVQIFADDSLGETDVQEQYCISIEQSQATLNLVVEGMVKKGGYSSDPKLRKKYAAKVCAVLRLIAKALRHLHNAGVVHGDVSMENCGKFEHAWKLLGRLDVQKIGDKFNPARFHQSFPPEALQLDETEGTVFDSDSAAVSFQPLTASTTIDIWGFGKLAFEALVGRPLVEFDPTKKTFDDAAALLRILEWDQSDMERTFGALLDSGVTESCAELVVSCLFPSPDDRPGDMETILKHEFWTEMRQYRERSSPSKRRGDTASSAYTTDSPQKSIITDTASAVESYAEIETGEI
eukprot:Nitzschia sp. Nitz4//scaffold15_size197535//72790//78495//NITZ4_001576-RA/size197535-augustus-gene-0.120-mRNA-1//1//CDS//3329537709//8479//frame0